MATYLVERRLLDPINQGEHPTQRLPGRLRLRDQQCIAECILTAYRQK